MSGIRRFFWNTQKSFMGIEFLKYAPVKAVILPATVILPAYILLNLNKGNLIQKSTFF